MIKISKWEKDYLVKRGLKFGTDNMDGDIHRTHSRYKHYYLTESARAMRLINQLRSSYEER